MEQQSRRSWVQFSMRSILWLMLCVAVGFAAYRRGFDDGFADGANSRHHVGETYVKAYHVADLMLPILANGKTTSLDSERLIRDITANVLPNTWNENGGQAGIRAFERNLSLVVSHDQDGHDRVAAYLTKRRDKINQLATRK
jgi:hypothetical protein